MISARTSINTCCCCCNNRLFRLLNVYVRCTYTSENLKLQFCLPHTFSYGFLHPLHQSNTRSVEKTSLFFLLFSLSLTSLSSKSQKRRNLALSVKPKEGAALCASLECTYTRLFGGCVGDFYRRSKRREKKRRDPLLVLDSTREREGDKTQSDLLDKKKKKKGKNEKEKNVSEKLCALLVPAVSLKGCESREDSRVTRTNRFLSMRFMTKSRR